MVDNYIDLGNAVVTQAAADYTKVMCKLRDLEAQAESLKRFFTGDDIKIYTTLDGTALLGQLDARLEEYNYSYKAIKASMTTNFN